jgi:hypothetical protein
MRRSTAGARPCRTFGYDSASPWLGWHQNGDLLVLSEKESDAFITVDRKLGKQQDLTKFDIAVVLIRSRSNRLEDIRPLVPELLGAISRAFRRALTSVDKP